MRTEPGAIVDFFSEGEVHSGVILAEEKGRLRVAREDGREQRIAPGRILAAYAGSARIAPAAGAKGDGARLDAAARLAAAHSRAARERQSAIDLALVWELVVDEGSELSLEDLAELAGGERSDAARAGTLRALLDEKTHFTRRGELWSPRARTAVAEILHQREQERRRAEDRDRLIARARDAIAGREKFIRTGDEEEARILAALEEVAVQGGGASAAAAREADWAVAQLGIRAQTPEVAAFRLLVLLGALEEDENLFIRRFGLHVAFPEETESLAERAITSAPSLDEEVSRGARVDLTHLDLFSVDDELTSEIDDALSVESDGEGRWRVGIHIADPGFLVRPGDPLDTIAGSRAVTFYLPERRVLMLPPVISERAASLVPGEPRPGLSFFATLDESGTLLESRITPSVVLSRARVTYEEASRAIRSEAGAAPTMGPSVFDGIRALHHLATALETARIAAGAQVIRAPEIDLIVGANGVLSLKRLEGDDPARILVSEMMVLASRLAASFCLQGNIPCIYRRQPPSEEGSVPPAARGPYDPVAVRRARRGLRRSESGLTPGRHFALGLDAYAQATSPIRRYQDMVIHRQIVSVLRDSTACYDAESLARIAVVTDEAERVARLAERGSDEYWTLRYLSQRKGEIVEGVVVFVDRRRVEVELAETLYTTSIAPRPDHEPGQRLRFVIEDVQPRLPSLTLRQVD